MASQAGSRWAMMGVLEADGRESASFCSMLRCFERLQGGELYLCRGATHTQMSKVHSVGKNINGPEQVVCIKILRTARCLQGGGAFFFGGCARPLPFAFAWLPDSKLAGVGEIVSARFRIKEYACRSSVHGMLCNFVLCSRGRFELRRQCSFAVLFEPVFF